MSYETGPATTHEDLINKLSTFLTANGFTQDEHDTGSNEFAIHLTSGATVFVSMLYDNTNIITLHQALAFTGGNAPGTHPNDSGNGGVTERRWSGIGAGPFPAYHFFTDDTTYAHIVLEYTAGLYRHMIFGQIIKEGTWTGGEYCAAHSWAASPNNDDPTASGHALLFDSRTAAVADGGTIHIEGLPDEPSASTMWGAMFSGTAAGLDTAGVAREVLHGGIRDSYLHRAFGHVRADPASGNVSLIPIEVYRRRTAPSPDEMMKLGVLPDIRAINMHFFESGQEFTQGADTWKVFPWTRKRFLQDNAEESWNMGVAYKKIV